MADTDVIDPPAPVVITDEQFFAEIEKRTGAKVENVDVLKEKITYQKPAPLPTDAEKEKAAKDLEKRMLDVHIANGKTPEQYTLLKQIANGDLKELSVNQTKAELKEAGFKDAEITEILKERYYQIEDADIEAEDDPAKKEILKKKKEFGTKKLEGRASHIQKQAKSYIDSLTESVNESDVEKKKMEQHASNVEAAIKNFQRKQTLELGKVDDTDIAPIEHEVPEAALEEVKNILKDPVAFEKQLYTKDGDVNLEFLLPHLVRSASYSNAIKHSYLVGGTRQVEHFEAAFGASAPPLGGQPKPNLEKGKVVSRGKSVYVAPSN